jgi:hypothetical protein
MIDIKIMKEIAEKSQEAVKYMTVLHSAKKRNMKWDVDVVMSVMQDYDDLCKEIQKLANEN